MRVEPTAHAKRPPLGREIVGGLAVFGVYVVVASFTSGRRDTADHNAQALLAFEQSLHIDIEKALNDWLVPHPVLTVLANYEYAYTYVISAFMLLIWLYVRHPDDFRRARSSFILLNLSSILCFALLPVTPPRLLTGLGYADTVTNGTTFGSWGTPLVSSANNLAAMPSLHVAWALWVSVVLARLARGITVQLISAVHVALTVFVIVATANHFIIDAIAAIPFVWLSVAVVDWHRSRTRPSSVPAADAFFLHVETDTAPQHVGGMVVLARSDGAAPSPNVDDVRALVRDELEHMPRFRQRLGHSPVWRRPQWIDVDPAEMNWDWHVTERWNTYPGVTDETADDLDAASAVLSRTVAEMATERMPRDRPMWRIVVVREITPGRSGLLFLVHHGVADGIGTVIQALNVLQPRLDLPVSGRSSPGRMRTALATTVGLAQLATDGKPAAKLPPGSAARQFATAAFDLDTVRSVARDHRVRVTDILLAVVAVAVKRTHPTFATSVNHRLRVSIPIMLREPGSAAEGNLTAAAMVDLPLADTDPATRLSYVHQLGARLLTPTRALASRFVMAKVLGALPVPAQRWFARTVYGPTFLQAIVSNMPGPAWQMSLAGAPFERVVPILPLAPGAPLAVGALSWTGVLGIGLAADPQFLEADALVKAMPEALRELARDTPASAAGAAAVAR